MSPRPEGGSPPTATEPIFEVFCSRHFTGWLAEARLSLAFTTYQAGKLFFLGLNRDGRLSVFNRTLSRCMGLWGDGQTLYLSTLFQLWRFENSLGPGETYQGYDRLYVPRVGWTTGDLDIHDIGVDPERRPVFVSTLFGCLATVSERYSFVPLWKPPFVSKLWPSRQTLLRHEKRAVVRHLLRGEIGHSALHVLVRRLAAAPARHLLGEKLGLVCSAHCRG